MGAKLDIAITGNSAGFATALNKAKEDARNFSTDVSGGIFKGFNQGFAGLVANWRVGLIASVVGIPALLGQKFAEIQERAKAIKLGSIRTGLSTDEFQRVSNVTESTGLDTSSAAHAIDHIAKAQAELKHGSLDATRQTDKLASAFASLGISVAQVESLSPQQLFFKIAEAMKEAAAQGKLTGEQIAAMKEVLGKAGPELIPAFAKGFEGTIKDTANLTEEEVNKMVKSSKMLDGVKGVWGEYLKTIASLAGMSVGGYKLAAAWLFDALPGGKLSAESGIKIPEPQRAILEAGRDRLTAREQRDRESAAEKRDQAIHDKKFGEEAKKIEAEIAAERLKQGTPEEKRAALLKEIAAHEKEIAEIRSYQEAGAFSETEARLRIDRETLEIEKRKNALAELDKKHESAKPEGDRWAKLGLRDVAPITATLTAPPRTAAQDVAAVRQNIAALEQERKRLTGSREGTLPETQEVLSPDAARRVADIDRELSAARRYLINTYFPTQREESNPNFVGPRRENAATARPAPAQTGSTETTAQPAPAQTGSTETTAQPAPEQTGSTAPTAQPAPEQTASTAMVPAVASDAEQGRAVITQLYTANSTQREMDELLRRIADLTAATVRPAPEQTGSTAMVPAVASDAEQGRAVITQLYTANSTQREMATLLRRMAESLA